MSKKRSYKKQPKTSHGIHYMGIGQIKANRNKVVIEGLANKNIVDRGNDIIAIDAWELDNYKKNPVILYNHGMDAQLGGTPVGKAVEIKPTKDGLYVKAELSMSDDPVIKRIRDLVEERMLRAFSVGFDPKDADVDSATGVKEIKKAELFEISIVGVPMNQESLFELSGKALKLRSVKFLKGDLLKRKGAWVAGAVHNRIYEMQKEGEDRDRILRQIAELADVDNDMLMDILAGNVTPIPEEVLESFSEILGLDLDELQNLDQADAEIDDSDKEDMSDDTEQEDSEENEEKEEDMPEQEDSEDEEKGDMDGDGQEDDEDIVDAPEETKKEDNEDEIEDMKSFQDCVSQKIPKLIDEGMGQEQAIAVAIEMCSDGKKVKPPMEAYEKWFKIAAQGRKQADQENVEDNPTAIAAGNTEAENDDFGSPQLDAMRQTNVLLGALINQMQLLNAKFDALSPKSEEKEESYDSEALQDESKDQKSIQTNSGDASLSQEHQTILDNYAKRLKNIKKRLESLEES